MRGRGKSEWPLVVAALLFVVVALYSTSLEEGNRLLAAGLQASSLTLSIYASYRFAQATAEESARAVIRPHARSAFRRNLNLYRAVQRLILETERQVDRLDGSVDGRGKVTLDEARQGLYVVRAMAVEQAYTADDALEDWRDLVPEEVAEVEARVEKGQLPYE